MRYVMAILGGAVVGAGAALLFAPATGETTRSMIKDKATKVSNDVQDFVESKSQHLKNKMQGMKHQASTMANTMMEQNSEIIDTGRDLMDRTKDLIDTGREAYDKVMSAATSTTSSVVDQPAGST